MPPFNLPDLGKFLDSLNPRTSRVSVSWILTALQMLAFVWYAHDWSGWVFTFSLPFVLALAVGISSLVVNLVFPMIDTKVQKNADAKVVAAKVEDTNARALRALEVMEDNRVKQAILMQMRKGQQRFEATSKEYTLRRCLDLGIIEYDHQKTHTLFRMNPAVWAKRAEYMEANKNVVVAKGLNYWTHYY